MGTGEFFRALEQKVSWLRDRVMAAFKGEPPGASNLKVAVESGLESLILAEGDAAAERAEASWQANAAGRELIRGVDADLSRSSPQFARETSRAIRDWQGAVLDLVADAGMAKRSKARFLALGVNGVGVALMIVVFAHTGGLVGAEVGVAGGTAVLAQRVLEAVFGDQAVRRLAAMAKEDLDTRVEALLSAELRRYHAVLDSLAVTREQAEDIRRAATRVQAARVDGLPESADLVTPGEAALEPAAERAALEAPRVSRSRCWRRARRMTDVVRGRARRAVPVRGLALMAGKGLALLHRREQTAGLVDRVKALREAAELCSGRVDPAVVTEAHRVVDQADRRLSISGAATVVALAGATGSGKSSTFNALAGVDLATVGVRRPTTSQAMAASWGEESAEELLDWLKIPRRHAVEAAAQSTALSGLVLLDLPDHDSTEVGHRLEVDRLVALVDMLIWVVDPQKYADAALHDRYLKPLAQHADVMMVVLNQADTLTPAQREQCLQDLRRLLASEGLGTVPVLAVSARDRRGAGGAAYGPGQTGGGQGGRCPSAGRRRRGRRRPAVRRVRERFGHHRRQGRERPTQPEPGPGGGGQCGRRRRRSGVATAGRPGDRLAGARLAGQVQTRSAAPTAPRPARRRPQAPRDRPVAGGSDLVARDVGGPEGPSRQRVAVARRPGLRWAQPRLGRCGQGGGAVR